MAKKIGKGMRLTSTRARKNKNGTALSTVHNDRNFEEENAPHIDPERSKDNTYWHCYKDTSPELTFEQAEARFYEEYFAVGQDAKNQRYIKSGHREDCRTIVQLRKEIAPPEEMIIQIGRASADVGQPSQELLEKAWKIYKSWHEEIYPQIKFLNDATHVDEYSIHKHSRQVYCAKDKYGHWIPNIEKCLEQMGVPRPFPEKKRGRHNNRKMVYTKYCRDKLFQICQEIGLELVTEPKEKGLSGRTIDEVRTEGLRKDLEVAQQQNQEAQKNLKETNSEIWEARMELGLVVSDQQQAELALKFTQDKLQKQRNELYEVQSQTVDAQRKTKEIEEGLDTLIDEYYEAGAILDSRSDADRLLDFLAEHHPEVLEEWDQKEQELADFWNNLHAKQEKKRAAQRRSRSEYTLEL